jgi:CHAD domain-containing protein
MAGATEQRERELKFDVPPEWQLPDLSRLVRDGGSVQSSVVELESTYFDTESRDLFDRRLTMRRRTGSIDEGWQLKVPAGAARTEIRMALDGTRPPRELQRLTQGVRRGAPLRPIAVLRTHRALHALTDAKGAPLAELVVDEVSASTLGSSTTLSQWREVEIELKDGDEELLRKLSKWLRKSGATTSPSSSKLARALDAVPASPKSSSKPLQGAVLDYLATQYDAIVTGDLALRRGQDLVHKTRVATRRYRSVLRVFDKYFDAGRAEALDAELKWYAGVLGDLRDLQVLQRHLAADLAELPVELVLGPVQARLDETFAPEIAKASRNLETAMRSKRYLALLDELRAWSDSPPMAETAGSRKQLAKRVTKAEKKYEKRLATARDIDADHDARNAAMHSARKAAKRARYTAELGIPALGKSARRARKHAKDVQTRLGDRQDAVIATQFLRRLGAVAGTTPGENGFTYGLLLGRQFEHGHLHET